MKTLITIIIAIIFFVLIMKILLMDLHEIFRNDTVSQKTKDRVSALHLCTLAALAVLAFRILVPNNNTTLSAEQLEEIELILFEIDEKESELDDSITSLFTLFDFEKESIQEAMSTLDGYFYGTDYSKKDAQAAYDKLYDLKDDYKSACTAYSFLKNYEAFINKKENQLSTILEK